MEHLWSHDPCDVKAVHRELGARRRITLHTVQSTMERLARKGLLTRQKVSHAFVYTAAMSREAYGTSLVRDVFADVLGAGTEPMLAAFVDVAAQEGDESLAALERLVAQRRAGRG